MNNKQRGNNYERKILNYFIDKFNFVKYVSKERNLDTSHLHLTRTTSVSLDALGVDIMPNPGLLPTWRKLGIQTKRFTFKHGVDSYRIPLNWILERGEAIKRYGMDKLIFIVGIYQKNASGKRMMHKQDVVVLELDFFTELLQAWHEKELIKLNKKKR